MHTSLPFIVAVVVLAVSFDFINGFHDTANAIATTVSTKALPPRIAIVMAAVMNFIGALAFTGVAKTIGGKIADPAKLEYGVLIVIAALLASIFWNLVTWWYGIPSSSSHALIGSVVGAVFISAGGSTINWSGFREIFEALILSPVIALLGGYLLMNIFYFLFRQIPTPPSKVNRRFRYFQILTAALQSFTRNKRRTKGDGHHRLCTGSRRYSIGCEYDPLLGSAHLCHLHGAGHLRRRLEDY